MEAKEELLHFLSDWLSGYISEELNDLINLIKLDNKNKYLRALSFQLYESNGILKRINVEDIVKVHSYRIFLLQVNYNR